MSKQTSANEGRQVDLEEIEVAINDLDSGPAAETLTGAIKDLPGVRVMRVTRGGVMISYNPIGITPEQIRAEIERAGFTVDGIESGRKSPMHPNPQPTAEPLDHLRPPPNVHPDPGGHKGQ